MQAQLGQLSGQINNNQAYFNATVAGFSERANAAAEAAQESMQQRAQREAEQRQRAAQEAYNLRIAAERAKNAAVATDRHELAKAQRAKAIAAAGGAGAYAAQREAERKKLAANDYELKRQQAFGAAQAKRAAEAAKSRVGTFPLVRGSAASNMISGDSPNLTIRKAEPLPSNLNRVDVTYWLYNEMAKNAQTEYTKEIFRLNTTSLPDWTETKPFALQMWKTAVNYEAPWDFKTEFNKSRITEVTIADSRLRFDVVANLHYGYVGAVAGFSTAELVAGAGIAQQQGGAKESGKWYVAGDDPVDTSAILAGVDLYGTYGSGMTYAQYLEGMKAMLYGGWMGNSYFVGDTFNGYK